MSQILTHKFRPATSFDIPALVRLVNSAYRGETSRAGWTTEADLLGGQRADAAMIAEMIVPPHRKILLMEDSAKNLLGCVFLEQKKNSCYLGLLTVDPQRQGQGLGHQLMGAAENEAKAWDCAVMEMTVIGCRHELIAFYQRRGYQPTGETRPFPKDESRFGVPQVADLDMVVLQKTLTPNSAPTDQF